MCTTHNGRGVVYVRRWKGTKASRRAIPETGEIATTMAVSVTEHCRGHRAVAQSDQPSRTAILVDDFTDRLVSGLFRSCRGFTFTWVPGERRWTPDLSPPNPSELRNHGGVHHAFAIVIFAVQLAAKI